MPLTRDPTPQDIRRVARRTVQALENCGYSSCLFGSAACHVWGMKHRNPKDVDVIVLTNDDPEIIKSKLAETNSRFILRPSNHPRKSHHLLYYAIRFQRPEIVCKVDILVPGLLDIPWVRKSRREYPNEYNIPVIPFLPLLLLKLKGWSDHRRSRRSDFQAKVPQDEKDIQEMLEMLDEDDHLSNNEWLPRYLIRNSERRIVDFVEEFPGTDTEWKYIGFDV
ncbi:hypothetical protein AMATHDRAFT_49290 [Amanita thiersii Skay4041]|uniref:Uncharacterized protein n=1 Tax=Amanita thiersii Skay4041 TaxID=703135 RepID=A0A2A9NLV4_9AGAR|nr:hypothetical protein AMATHDRAFT_49290 [Amanita thiersii Skay4041]